MLAQRARVLVTVKAYPTPSQTHGETVCIAGVRLDRPEPSWIRLYPINFRALDDGDRFGKYSVVDIDVVPGHDGRSESFRPRLSTAQVRTTLSSARGWAARWAHLDPLAGATTSCRLRHHASGGGPSLGLVKPLSVDSLEITRSPSYTAAQQQAVAAAAAPDLFRSAPRTPLEPPPFTLRYRYKCAEHGCTGHAQSVLDWEAGQFGRRLLRQGHTEAEATAQLRAKFLDQMCGRSRDYYFYLGNLAKHPASFMVLGVFWPPAGSRPAPTLF